MSGTEFAHNPMNSREKTNNRECFVRHFDVTKQVTENKMKKARDIRKLFVDSKSGYSIESKSEIIFFTGEALSSRRRKCWQDASRR